MKLVRPGAVVSGPPLSDGAARRVRLGRAAGALLGAGWLLSLALTLAAGPRPDAPGTLLALSGAGIGAILAGRRWDRQTERSLRLLVVVGALHSAAAMVALDPSATVSAPIFLAVAVMAGLLAPGRIAVLACALTLAGVALAVAALAPARDAAAVGHALVLAPALMLAASLTAGARAWRVARANRAVHPLHGDPSLVHKPLADRAHRDPDRFARLAMDLDLQAGRGMSVADGNRLLRDIAEAIISHVRVSAVARRRATEMLVERLERTVANIELEALGWFNFEQAYAEPLEDSPEAAELIRRADEALAEARARRGRRPLPAVADAPPATERLPR
ncbi:MAG TPA: hypothetical protein VGJ32_15935 [Solirubrobacteraceae bacterium]